VSRTRALIVVALVVVFVIVGGVLIYANTQKGGKDVTFNVTVTGANSMSPSTLSATQNDKITITVTSDQEGEVHLHVYDIAFEVKPGEPATHTFTADKTCSCEIEWEDTSTHLGELDVKP
jgi:nitrous oxide reductase